MNIGIIGAGNMASALAGGLISSKIIKPEELSISDKNTDNLEKWKKNNAFTTSDNVDVVRRSFVVILAVKPNILPIVLEEIKCFSENKIFISIAAGITIESIENILGDSVKILRAMPNTPAKVNCGMTVIAPNKRMSDADVELAQGILSAVGEVIVLEEKHINAATALHGSSPAYVYMLIDAMADGGVKHGIPKNIALRLAAKAVEGAAKMVLETEEHPQILKDAVCSPGGTTIAAVCELEKEGFQSAVTQAIDACVNKANEISG